MGEQADKMKKRTGEDTPPTQAGRPARSPSGLAGHRLGQYEILAELGRGGMGVVYKAHDRTLDRTVAVKVLPPHLAEDPDFTKRFIREARAAAKLDHPGIVQVYQVAKAEDTLFIAMQYVEAKPLSKVIDEQGPQEQKKALAIVRQVAEALAQAHEHGIVHRDIKPSNIMVDDKLRVKVMDFGLAKQVETGGKITHTGIYIGTPEYSSPEQCETKDLDGRADIYSLGVVLYEMLSGKVPFSAETPLKLFEKICYEEPQPVTKAVPGISRELAKLLDKMMAKSRDDRYQDCAELIRDIDRIGRGEALKIETRRKVRAARRQGSSPLVSLAVVAGVLALMGAFYLIVSAPGGTHAPNPQRGERTAPHAATELDQHRRTVVVRDFDNTTGRTDLEWLRIGIADMLITDLAGCEFLDVLSREKVRETTSSAAPQPAKADIEIKGSFAEAGGRILVMAQLLDEKGTVIRSARSSGLQDGIFTIIDEVSSQIRSGLEDLLARRLGGGVKLAAAEGGVASRLFVASADAEQLRRAEGANTLAADKKAADGSGYKGAFGGAIGGPGGEVGGGGRGAGGGGLVAAGVAADKPDAARKLGADAVEKAESDEPTSGRGWSSGRAGGAAGATAPPPRAMAPKSQGAEDERALRETEMAKAKAGENPAAPAARPAAPQAPAPEAGQTGAAPVVAAPAPAKPQGKLAEAEARKEAKQIVAGAAPEAPARSADRTALAEQERTGDDGRYAQALELMEQAAKRPGEAQKKERSVTSQRALAAKARYEAIRLLESAEQDPDAIRKAVELLENARTMAPDYKVLGEDIARAQTLLSVAESSVPAEAAAAPAVEADVAEPPPAPEPAPAP